MRIHVDPLDLLFSRYVRLRAIRRVGGCERCLKPKDINELQCSHFFGRGRRSVRYDPSNACGFCFGCHQFFGANPLEHVRWFRNHLEEQEFAFLEGRMRQIGKVDREAIRLYLQEEIKKFEKGEGQ